MRSVVNDKFMVERQLTFTQTIRKGEICMNGREGIPYHKIALNG